LQNAPQRLIYPLAASEWQVSGQALKGSLQHASKGRAVMRANVVASGFILTLLLATSSQAQVLIDASKITCDQFVHGKIGNIRTIAAWLSGFYNGKQDNRILDKQSFEANLNKLESFCYQEKNFTMPVMQAIEQAIGTTR
jgi:acid stress chaperone HdeB